MCISPNGWLSLSYPSRPEHHPCPPFPVPPKLGSPVKNDFPMALKFRVFLFEVFICVNCVVRGVLPDNEGNVAMAPLGLRWGICVCMDRWVMWGMCVHMQRDTHRFTPRCTYTYT